MVSEIKIGNVTFDENQIDTHTERTHHNGQKVNCVLLKNGTKIEFYNQKEEDNASVTVGTDMNTGKDGTALFGLTGFTLAGSDRDDYYYLTNCDYYNIDLEQGGKDEIRIFDTDGTHSKHNCIRMDAIDEKSSLINPNMIEKDEGVFVAEDTLKPTDEDKEFVENFVKTNILYSNKFLKEEELLAKDFVKDFIMDMDNEPYYYNPETTEIIKVKTIKDDGYTNVYYGKNCQHFIHYNNSNEADYRSIQTKHNDRIKIYEYNINDSGEITIVSIKFSNYNCFIEYK